jgi:hypothetical protein
VALSVSAGAPRRCKSFVFGVIFGSVTWTVILILYSRLVQESNLATAPRLSPQPSSLMVVHEFHSGSKSPDKQKAMVCTQFHNFFTKKI